MYPKQCVQAMQDSLHPPSHQCLCSACADPRGCLRVHAQGLRLLQGKVNPWVLVRTTETRKRSLRTTQQAQIKVTTLLGARCALVFARGHSVVQWASGLGGPGLNMQTSNMSRRADSRKASQHFQSFTATSTVVQHCGWAAFI